MCINPKTKDLVEMLQKLVGVSLSTVKQVQREEKLETYKKYEYERFS